MFIDTHAHLNFDEFDNDYDQVIKRAQTRGVEHIIIPSSDPYDSKKAVEIAYEYPHVYPCIGAHPLHIVSGFSLISDDGLPPTILLRSYDQSHALSCTLDYFAKVAEMENIIAIGEIGLDYKSEPGRTVKRDVQLTALSCLIEATIELNKPYIFHCRGSSDQATDALQDLYSLLKKYEGKLTGVVHCFPGDASWAKKFISLGLKISYTGLITFVDKFNPVIKEIDLDNILLETDAPFLAPKPYRDERCEPAYLIEVAKHIAKVKNLPLEEVEKITTQEAQKLFAF